MKEGFKFGFSGWREPEKSMDEKRYVVPTGMHEAAVKAIKQAGGSRYRSTEDWALLCLEAAVRWFSEHPIVPTDKQYNKITEALEKRDNTPFYKAPEAIARWMNVMFLDAPKPEEIKLNPQKCPHQWNSRNEIATMEIVVYCELCDWEYSRTAIESMPRKR